MPPKSQYKGMKLDKNGRRVFDFNAIKRTVKMLMKYYPVLFPLICVCIIFSSAASAIPGLYTQKITEIILANFEGGDWNATAKLVIPQLIRLAILYGISILSIVLYTQLNAVMTQGFLSHMRGAMFEKMQNLPLSFFDRKKTGDTMSYYTNDIDTLRELISQAIPALLRSGSIIIVVFGIMIWYSVPLTLMILIGVFVISLISGKMGNGSARFFVRQQQSVAATEGFIQEAMNGQKVIKVFCHEKASQEGFDKLNAELRDNSFRAHAYANALGPIVMNIGNVLYVLLVALGGAYILLGLPNLSLSGKILDVSILVAFLNMTKQFTSNVNQLAQQINTVVMGMAGASRVFDLLDREPESDEGRVTLANVKRGNDGQWIESEKRTGHWAWKIPQEDGTFRFNEIRGDVRMTDVYFQYNEKKKALFGISVYAEPGQKVAFVGATGAGKTTITNLINRFYDINEGQILYDGVNVFDIRKADLRRSLGIVLQETNLFTGSVMENIRYGKLDATDEECRAAAQLAGADDFITRLPDGYDTLLTNNGSNLSQGQRQLIAIARAAVADPPVMIMDEATSSIDTRTEAIVQRGMDKLMEGRTVFVIAHRLSTVRNSDVIMVLDHGKIIERGNHEKLIAEKGTYYQLYTGAFELD